MAIQFSDTSSEKNGLIQTAESWVFGDDSYGRISDNSDLLATFTRNMNRGLDRAVGKILASDGRWQWDDTNYTTYPIGFTDLVSGQQDYTFDREHIEILKVERQDESGEYHELHPIDIQDLRGRSITELFDNNGTPQYFDLLANAIWLYPAPNYNQTNGLKVFYQRNADYFTTSDTTKEPGINPMFQEYPALWSVYVYALKERMELASSVREEITQMENMMQSQYQRRNRADRKKMTARPTRPR